MLYDLTKRPNETEKEYRYRLYDYRRLYDPRFSFQTIADLIADETGIIKHKSTYAREYNKYIVASVVQEDSNETEATQLPIEDMQNLLFEAQKERFKSSDERTQMRAYMRRISREETIKEIALEAAEKIANSKQLLPTAETPIDAAKCAEAILELSDWHFGLEVNNYWNTFSPDICKERIAVLLKEVISFCYTFGVSSLHIVNLNDLIAGRIHSTIRLESRCDVITQTIEVSEILAEFISAITNEGITVHYYDCLDNHSRLEPIKAESLDLESLTRIIPWYLETRMRGNKFFNIHSNEFGDDIITFDVFNGKYSVAAVHGHKDRPNKVVDNLTMMTKVNYDLILTAHLHHFSCDEKNETLVVSNGSLMGTDTYAKDLRLSSRASQNIILVTEDSVADYIHRIILN